MVKVGYPHYRTLRPMGDEDARVHIYTVTALGRGRARPPFTPEESHGTHFYRRLRGPQDRSGHEEVKKNLHPSVHPVAKCFAASASWLTPNLIILKIIFIISVLPKGRSFTANSGTKDEILPKGMSSIANSRT